MGLLFRTIGVLQAWIVINLFSAVVRDPFWSRTFAIVAWVLAALYTLRLLNPMIAAGAMGLSSTMQPAAKLRNQRKKANRIISLSLFKT